MLNPRIEVHEPIWTVLTSNKNILKLLYDMFPTSEYILKTSNELTQDLKASGYVRKPYSGRCGKNVTLFNDSGNVLDASAGNLEAIGSVYQELHLLPVIEGKAIQMNTFAVGGTYAGSVLRVDSKLIIDVDSDVMALRIVEDSAFL